VRFPGEYRVPAPAPLLGDFKGRASAREVALRLDSGQFNRKACRLEFHSITASVSEISGKYSWVDCRPQFKGKGTIEITPIPPA